MDRYTRVEKPKADPPINENEIRVTSQGRARNYIAYATTLLQEKGSDEVVLKAMGRAINKTVMVSESIKMKVVGLHQNISIGSVDITDVWEPIEEGLLPLETTRHVSMIAITLSKKELDTSSTGYQTPLAADKASPPNDLENEEDFPSDTRGRGRSGRGGGRGRGRGNYYGAGEYDGSDWYDGRGYGRGGRGRVRTQNFRGRGGQRADGCYDSIPVDAPPHGRGRGRSRGTGRGRGHGRGRGMGPDVSNHTSAT